METDGHIVIVAFPREKVPSDFEPGKWRFSSRNRRKHAKTVENAEEKYYFVSNPV